MKDEALKRYIVNIVLQIRNLRKKNGLTQIEFAKRAGVGLRFLRELEQGKTTVRVDKLMQVSNFLGYHLDLRKNESENELKIESEALLTKLSKRKIT
jgi:y4mF family transcriptional regulator